MFNEWKTSCAQKQIAQDLTHMLDLQKLVLKEKKIGWHLL